MPGASFERRYQPTPALPMKLKKATLGSVTSFSAASRSLVGPSLAPGFREPGLAQDLNETKAR